MVLKLDHIFTYIPGEHDVCPPWSDNELPSSSFRWCSPRKIRILKESKKWSIRFCGHACVSSPPCNLHVSMSTVKKLDCFLYLLNIVHLVPHFRQCWGIWNPSICPPCRFEDFLLKKRNILELFKYGKITHLIDMVHMLCCLPIFSGLLLRYHWQP